MSLFLPLDDMIAGSEALHAQLAAHFPDQVHFSSARFELASVSASRRSSVAHGRPDVNAIFLVDSFELLRRVLIRIIDRGALPTKPELDVALLGMEPWADRESPRPMDSE